MQRSTANLIRRFASIVVAAIVVALLWRLAANYDWRQIAVHARSMDRPLVALAMLFGCGPLLLSAIEWTMFLPSGCSMTFGRMYRAAAITVLLQNSLHHLSGQAYFIVRLTRREGVRWSDTASIVALDQSIEGVVKLGWVLLAASLVSLPPSFSAAAITLACGALGILASLSIVVLIARRMQGATASTSRWDWRRLLPAFESVSRLCTPRVIASALLLALGKKITRALAVACIQAAVGLEAPWYAAIVVVAAIDLVTLLPLVPGHVGVFEAAIALVYHVLGVDAELGLIAALAFHAVWLLASLVPGILVFGVESFTGDAEAVSNRNEPPVVPEIEPVGFVAE